MKKRVLAILLALAMIAALLPAVALATNMSTSEHLNMEYTIDKTSYRVDPKDEDQILVDVEISVTGKQKTETGKKFDLIFCVGKSTDDTNQAAFAVTNAEGFYVQENEGSFLVGSKTLDPTSVFETEITVVLPQGETEFIIYMYEAPSGTIGAPDYTTITPGDLSLESYFVTYDDGVSDSSVTNIPDKDATSENTYAIPADATPTRTGYHFTGWKDTSGKTYQPGDTINGITSAVTLAAQWLDAGDVSIDWPDLPAGVIAGEGWGAENPTIQDGKLTFTLNLQEGYDHTMLKVFANNTELSGTTADGTLYTYTFPLPADGQIKLEVSEPAKTQATVTFRVVNGRWSDGTTGDKTVAVAMSGGSGTLAADQIPTPVAAYGYSGGSWDTTPSAGSVITGDTVFTYTFYETYYAPPIILTQPQAATATEGGTASFSVSAINPNNPWNPNDLFIRWMISYDGGRVWKEFAVGPTAELPVTMAENGMLVQCRVNSGTEVRLDPVTVTVLPGMDIVPGEEEIIDPGEEGGDVQEGTEETVPEEGETPEEGLEELPEEGEAPAEEEPVDVPKTGDSLPSTALALVLGLAACAVVLKKARAK